ncbi:pseudouridine synthase [Vibrio kagoshimensis]|uniref:RluA family pseudouridine synthase n=1 Tax=Vibrio kagoshimensis TaxID=2910244 RepID=UPI003D22F908
MPKPMNCFIPLPLSSHFTLPKRFTFPYYYTPHPIADIAASLLQDRLTAISVDDSAIGNLYAVLVVRNTQGELGYLSAFSGLDLQPQLSDLLNDIPFVPAIFDAIKFQQEHQRHFESLVKLTEQIDNLEKQGLLAQLVDQLKATQVQAELALKQKQQQISESKTLRKATRKQAEQDLSEPELADLIRQLGIQSSQEKRELKSLKTQLNDQIEHAKTQLEDQKLAISSIEEAREKLEQSLEHARLANYQFHNQDGHIKSLDKLLSRQILDEQSPNERSLNGQTAIPGTGDCCFPKLLNYAFQHNLTPVALTEFWWGTPPQAEVRQHKNLYPVCQSKCFEILEHMLEGVELDENPLIVTPSVGKTFDIIYEDTDFIVVNKPEEFLSVPGKFIEDSIYTRVKALYPKATGPLIVHRLDMSTSGLLVLALTAEANKHIQKQFIDRTVEKRYTALIDGLIENDSGTINLPLRGDMTDRPRQLVCHQHGRTAETKWEVVARNNATNTSMPPTTKVHLYPKTGRTHQLRVHCAHVNGLGLPITGDDLYGFKRDRLYLHAGYLKFTHPSTGEAMEFEVAAKF